jgi:hypothetical protein
VRSEASVLKSAASSLFLVVSTRMLLLLPAAMCRSSAARKAFTGLHRSGKWGKQNLRYFQLDPRQKQSLASCAALPRGGADGLEISPSESTRRISFVTDIEGDRDYLDRYVQQSRVLRFRETDTKSMSADKLQYFPYDHRIEFQRPQDVLVFGGDAWDQGGCDLYVIRQLLDLKERHPERVFFVLGNRDLNKMRMHAELAPLDRHHPGVYWLRGSGRLGDPERENPELQDPVQRLQWMLRDTMGSPRAFSYRKQELEGELGRPVSDLDVVESYRSSCHPDGEMGRYLSHGCLTLRLGDALFVHGSLPPTPPVLSNVEPSRVWDDFVFAMPWLKGREESGVNTVDDWIQALNAFAHEQITEWRKKPSTRIWSSIGGYGAVDDGDHPGEKVMQYGMGWLPDKIRNPTIVYASWSTDGMPRRFFPTASEEEKDFVETARAFAQRSGIRLICSGHQPQGDMPNAIRLRVSQDSTDSTTSDKEKSLAWILSCDTSYSGDVLWWNSTNADDSRSNRGREGSLSARGRHAVSEVLLTQCLETGQIEEAFCHGVLSDGSPYESKPLSWHETEDNEELVVGCLAQGGNTPTEDESPHQGPWWTRAALQDGSHLLAAGSGYQAWNHIVCARTGDDNVEDLK